MLKAWYFTVVKYVHHARLDYALIKYLKGYYGKASCDLWFRNGGSIYGLFNHKFGGERAWVKSCLDRLGTAMSHCQ